MFFRENAIYLYSEMNTISGIVCAVLLFCGFRNIKMKSNYILNKIAGCMFGVYLFHDNPYIRHYLWVKVLKNAYWFNKKNVPNSYAYIHIGGVWYGNYHRIY